MAGRICKPKTKSFWILVRRLLLCKNRKPPAPAAEEEKSGLLGRNSLEKLLLTDGANKGEAAAGGACRCTLACAKKHGQEPLDSLLPARLHRPVMARSESSFSAAAAGGGRDGAPVHRRFMFGGFRRRLLMRRPWRPMLVAIPE